MPFRARSAIPATLDRFVEIPLDGTRDAWLDAIAEAGCSAKVRTGGLTADRFPSPASLAALLAACAHRGLPLKATAGLHHADSRRVPAHLRRRESVRASCTAS